MFVCAHPAIDPARALGADAADRPRPRRGAHRLGVPGCAGDAGATPGPRQDQDPQPPASPSSVPRDDESARASGRRPPRRSHAAHGTGWDDVAGTDPETCGLAQEALTAGGDAGAARSPTPPRRGGWRRADRLLPVACRARGATPPATTSRSPPRTRRAGTASCPRSARRRCSKAAALGVPGRVPDRGGDPVGAHPAPARRRAFPTRAIVALYDAAGRTAADDRRERQPRLQPSARPMAPRPAWRRSRRSLPPMSAAITPYWAALAHLASPHGDAADGARSRASAPSASAPTRRCVAFCAATAPTAELRRRPYWRSILPSRIAPPPCASSSA